MAEQNTVSGKSTKGLCTWKELLRVVYMEGINSHVNGVEKMRSRQRAEKLTALMDWDSQVVNSRAGRRGDRWVSADNVI